MRACETQADNVIALLAAIALAVFICASATGCAALVPNSITPELEHLSHASQHHPFTENPARYGANLANLVLRWDLGSRLHLDLAEGASLDKRYAKPQYAQDSCGEVEGPREEFSARIGYSFNLK